MTDTRPPPSRVAFLGFSEFERSSLTSYFRLAAERDHRYELVHDVSNAQFLVADADNAPSVQLVVVTERLGETVFIGSHAPPGAIGSMRRPIDALHVMRALDALANRDSPPVVVPVDAADAVPVATPVAPSTTEPPLPAATRPPSPGVIVESMLRMPAIEPPAYARHADPPPPPAARAPQPPTRRVSSHSALTAPRLAPPRPPENAAAVAAFVGPPPPARALLVDDSSIARRFLATRLAPWCVRTDDASNSAEALQRLAQQAYDFIFLDLELGAGSELDGLALCRQIKRNELAISATVVMVSAHHSEIDRARGSLAGCDGYLSKPLKEAELATLLRRQGLMPPEGAPLRAPTPAA